MSSLNRLKKHLEALQRKDGSLALAVRGLDAELATQREALPPQLVHYLVQRSYDKALAFINAQLGVAEAGLDRDNPPPGGCGGNRTREVE